MLAETLQLSQPWMLALAALAVAPWLLAGRARRRGRRLPWLAAGLESLAILTLSGALAQPRLPAPGRQDRPVAVFVDTSASQKGLPARLDGPWPGDLPRSDYLFAAGLGQAGQAPPADQTLIVGPLAMIESLAGRLAGAVIVTDGQFTDAASLSQTAGALAKTGLPIFLIPRAPAPGDARLADLTARSGRDGQVHLSATVVADAPMERTLRLTRDGQDQPLLERKLQLLPGQPATVPLIDTPPPGPTPRYRAQLVENDLLPGNNAMSAIDTASQSEILWASASDAPPLLATSLPGGPTTPRVQSTSLAALPAQVDELLRYAAVAVVDPTGQGLSADQRSALAQYARTGGGVLMIGTGPYADPADQRDPLNQALPLTASPFQRKNLDITVLLDASGSMAESPASQPDGASDSSRKFDLVRQATLTMVRRQLVPQDVLRVFTFSAITTPRYQGTLGAGDVPAELERTLAAVQPVGGTRIVPALQAALDAKVSPGVDRLVIVLSDLQTEKFNPASWARQLAEKGISLAVVASGTPDDKAPLRRLAEELGAPFVHRADLSGLAEVFIQFLRHARGEAMIRGQARLKCPEPLFDTPLSTLPDIDAYLAAGKGPQAEVLAWAGDDPVLARRRCEAGRTVSLMLPLDRPYNAGWRNSPDARLLLGSALRWVSAPPGDPRFAGQLDRQPGQARLLVQANDSSARPMNDLSLQAELTWPASPARQAGMEITAPGTYSADLGDLGAEPGMLTVRQGPAGPVVWRQTLTGRYPPELARLGVNEESLRLLANLTGGRVVSPGELPANLQRVRDASYRDGWPWLLGAGLAIMLLDWLLIRLTRRPMQ